MNYIIDRVQYYLIIETLIIENHSGAFDWLRDLLNGMTLNFSERFSVHCLLHIVCLSECLCLSVCIHCILSVYP